MNIFGLNIPIPTRKVLIPFIATVVVGAGTVTGLATSNTGPFAPCHVPHNIGLAAINLACPAPATTTSTTIPSTTTTTIAAQGPGCGLTSPAFCDTFQAATGNGNRSGPLNGNIWGVSRNLAGYNFGSGNYNVDAQATLTACNGTTSLVQPPNDLVICNGQLREATNDNPNACNDCGTVTDLAMYPKQPFDFANRVGTVSFDVSNDNSGNHGAWPEFWMSDTPIPTPFSHFDSELTVPQHGFGFRMAAAAYPNQFGECPANETPPISTYRWTVDSAMIIRNYIEEDRDVAGNLVFGPNTGLTVTPIDCVTQPLTGSTPTSTGQMNRVQVKIISPTEIQVWASDAGSIVTREISDIHTGAALTLTRGLVWIEDAHYNADKSLVVRADLPNAHDHQFTWDNVGFDGPILNRDLTFDVLDPLTSTACGGVGTGCTNLGWNVPVGTPTDGTTTPLSLQTVSGMTTTNINVASGAIMTFEYYDPFPNNNGIVFYYKVNNGSWAVYNNPFVPCLFASTFGCGTTTIHVPVNKADLTSGPNTVSFIAAAQTGLSQIDIILIGAGGAGGSVQYGQVSAPATWVNKTSNLAGLASECGNLTLLATQPNTNKVIAGVAASGLWSTVDGGTSWTHLDQGAGAAPITNRPSSIVFDPTTPSTWWETGLYGSSFGVMKTIDNGNTFSGLGTPFGDDSISVDFTDPSRATLLVGGHETSAHVDLSTNAGANWSNIWSNLSASIGTAFTQEVLVINTNTFLIAAFTGFNGGTPGIYRTTNGQLGAGATYTRVSTLGPQAAPLVLADGTIYWATGNSLAKSIDNGATWTQVGASSGLQTSAGSGYGMTPIQLPSPDNRLVTIGTSNTLIVSSDGGVSWSTYGSAFPTAADGRIPSGVVYTNGAFYIWHWDCPSGAVTVPPDAIIQGT